MLAEFFSSKFFQLPNLPFEENFNAAEFRKFSDQYIYVTTWSIIIFYLISIRVLEKFMKSRPAYNLQNILVLWNLFLSIFSLFGAYRFWPAMFRIADKHEWVGTICNTEFYTNKPDGFWVLLFVASKVPELVDTYFLILRKKPVIFLHWYHHFTALLFVVITYRWWYAGSFWFGAMNYTVHFIMYGYYALMATRKFRFPKFISIGITSLQILQMMAGLFIAMAQFYQIKIKGNQNCETDLFYVGVILWMYGTYFVLFLNLFIKKYIVGSKSGKAQRKKEY